MSINRYAPGWLNELHAHLGHLLREFPDAHIYALIEGVHDESCYPYLKRSGRLPYFSIYANTPNADEEALGLSPILVEYRAQAREAWNALMSKTDGKPALSLILTPEPLSEMAARLTPWCVVDADGHALALSFADTRILPQLFTTLSPLQLAQFCGPALHWQYVARTGTWESLPMPGKGMGLPRADEVALEERQCVQLIAAAEADSILFQLRSTAARLIDCHAPAHAHALVRHWLACADHAQIGSVPERMQLCEWGLLHPGLEAHRRITEWLAMPSAPQTLESLQQRWQADAL